MWWIRKNKCKNSTFTVMADQDLHWVKFWIRIRVRPVRSRNTLAFEDEDCKDKIKSSVADPGYLSRIPDPFFFHPGSVFFHPGSRFQIFPIPDSGSASKNLSILTPKMVLKLSEIWPGCSSRILIFYPSRIQGSERHRIPDPEHCKKERRQFCSGIG